MIDPLRIVLDDESEFIAFLDETHHANLLKLAFVYFRIVFEAQDDPRANELAGKDVLLPAQTGQIKALIRQGLLFCLFSLLMEMIDKKIKTNASQYDKSNDPIKVI